MANSLARARECKKLQLCYGRRVGKQKMKWILACGLFVWVSTASAWADCSDLVAHVDSIETIEKFLDEFPVFSGTVSREEWRDFFNQISKMNFNGSQPVHISLSRTDRERKKVDRKNFTIAPWLISGWKQLGFIRSDGFWNFNLKHAEFSQKFEAVTGLEAGSDLTGYCFGVTEGKDFRASILFGQEWFPIYDGHVQATQGKYPFKDIHDFIFHAPWLVMPFNMKMFKLAASYDLLMLSTEYGSALRYLFEYAGQDHLTELRAGLQLVIREPATDSFLNPDQLHTFIRKFMSERTPNSWDDFQKLMQNILVYPDERISWSIALLVMETGLRSAFAKKDAAEFSDPWNSFERAHLLADEMAQARKDLESQLAGQR
jgi:hypothetical protein